MQIESISVADLNLDPSNARAHPTKNLDAIKGSLAKFGQQKPIVIDANNVVIAGNGTLEAAKALKWSTVQCVRSCLEGTDKMAFAIADNRTSELATWEDTVLRDSLTALDEVGFDLGSIGFDDEDLKQWLGEAEKVEPGCDEDEIPEQVETICKLGDLWILGDHRLLCGDSTDILQVERLMDGRKADLWLTDPPYGVAYESAGRRGKSNQHAEIKNDAMPLDKMGDFWASVAANALISTSDKASYYWFACQGGDQMMMMMSIGRAGWKVRH